MSRHRVRIVVGEGRSARMGFLRFVLESEGYDVVEILRKQRQDLVRLEVEVTFVQDPDPPWTFRSIHLRFVLTGTVDASKAAKAVDISEARYCAVAATIRSVVELTHEVSIVPIG